MKKNIKKNEKGFTLIFAVLVSVLVLAVGTSIINVALKQVVLSGSGRDSQFAFYAANTGIECAMYWDRVGLPGNNKVFATSTQSNGLVNPEQITCAGNEIIDEEESCDDSVGNDVGYCVEKRGSNATTKFRISFEPDFPYCVDVQVYKQPLSGSNQSFTRITSQGYNTCEENNPRRINRGLQFEYVI